MNQASHRAAVASETSFSCWGRARAARPAPMAVSRALSLQASAAGTHGCCRVRPVPNSFTASSHWQGTFRSACLTLQVPQVGEFLHQAGAFGLRALNARWWCEGSFLFSPALPWLLPALPKANKLPFLRTKHLTMH